MTSLATSLAHLVVLEPHPGILAFYDGRVPGHRFADGPNWVDDGALSLGVASYALIDGHQAIVYDTHVSVPHARFIRATLAARGVSEIRVVLSHWHLDHVAGTEVFADCAVIANARTVAHLTKHRAAIEQGSLHGMPAIAPLILPSQVFEGEVTIDLGGMPVLLIAANIHSDDATVIWLPERAIMLAGDTVEDCVTYVADPQGFAAHQRDLVRLASLRPKWVLPAHGDPGVIAAGGYSAAIFAAMARYVAMLQGLQADPAAPAPALADAIAPDVAAGTLIYFAPYEAVHAQNIAAARGHA